MPDSNRRTFIAGAAVTSLAGLAPSHAQTGAAGMHHGMSSQDVRKLLDLTPNATCGYVRVTYVAKNEIAAGGMEQPFADKRPVGSGLYFMVTPDEPVKLHRIKNDQFYHYYMGDPLEVLLLRGEGERIVMGPDLRAGQHVQFLIPGNTFHTARIIGTRQWFLGGSTEWPGVLPEDVELGMSKIEEFAAKFPKVAADIRSFPLPAK
jgi:predicted cupin superfamily sugar epimerase